MAHDVAVVVLTHNRLHLLRQCVENVLARTSARTSEILIWDNASSDGTAEYLAGLSEPRLTVVAHPENIGHNGYAEAFERTTASHLVELDDDVVDAPQDWDRMLLEAFERIPRIGFLGADLAFDEHDEASLIRHRLRADRYRRVSVAGIELLEGPTGGGCAMTSRALHDLVGGWPRHPGEIFFQEEAEYIASVEKLGYRKAVLAGLEVRHAGGPYYAGTTPAKERYWRSYWREVRRRNAVKRMLLAVPGVAVLNRSLELFGPLEWTPPRKAAAVRREANYSDG
jgi:GT2 family glycosyltransferase